MTKERSHPEDRCERCGGQNVTWFAPSELWNKAHGVYDILCPVCFVNLAEAAGIRPTAWQIGPEHHEPSLPRCAICGELQQGHMGSGHMFLPGGRALNREVTR